MSLKRVLVYLWALPTTLVGLVFLPLAVISGGGYQVVDGVLEIHGGFVEFFLRRCTLLNGGASAMTLGHVVLGRDEWALELTRDHERVHVRQCERWGPLFLPAYVMASGLAFLRRGTLLKGGASAMTLGHVVLGRDRGLLDLTRDHERVHVRQCERWGPLFLPAYLLGSALAWSRGQRAYMDNPFEREAYANDGRGPRRG